MPELPKVTWISYADVEKYEDPYKSLEDKDRRPHRIAIAQSIREQRVWISGTKHHSASEQYVPLVADRWAYTWSMRAWGDLMAQIWSGETGASYDYLDFYLSSPESPWGQPADDEAWSISEEDVDRLDQILIKRQEARAAAARVRLMEGVDSDRGTLSDAWPLLSASERIRALELATSPARTAPPLSPRPDGESAHEISAHGKNLAAAALRSYLAGAVRALADDPSPEGEIQRARGEELFAVLLVQRKLEEAKPRRKLFEELGPSDDEREQETD